MRKKLTYHRKLFFEEESRAILSDIKIFFNVLGYRVFFLPSPMPFPEFKESCRCFSGLDCRRPLYFRNNLIMDCYLKDGVRRCFQCLYNARQLLPRLGYRDNIFHFYNLILKSTICTLLYVTIDQIVICFNMEERRMTPL